MLLGTLLRRALLGETCIVPFRAGCIEMPIEHLNGDVYPLGWIGSYTHMTPCRECRERKSLFKQTNKKPFFNRQFFPTFKLAKVKKNGKTQFLSFGKDVRKQALFQTQLLSEQLSKVYVMPEKA